MVLEFVKTVTNYSDNSVKIVSRMTIKFAMLYLVFHCHNVIQKNANLIGPVKRFGSVNGRYFLWLAKGIPRMFTKNNMFYNVPFYLIENYRALITKKIDFFIITLRKL